MGLHGLRAGIALPFTFMCQKRVIDDDDYGALGEMIVRGN
jgi:hypothetical protein